MEYSLLNIRLFFFLLSTCSDMELVRLSDGLSRHGVLHILHNAELAVGQRVDTVYSSYWDLGSRQVVDFEDYTNILLWCDSLCVSSFLSKVGWLFLRYVVSLVCFVFFAYKAPSCAALDLNT